MCGIDARIVSVETDVGSGLPTFDMSGYLGTEVKEARDRVRIAIKNTGVELPPQRIVNRVRSSYSDRHSRIKRNHRRGKG